MKRYVYAMSVNQQDLSQQLLGASVPLIEHLTKLYLFPGLEYTNHWRKEVWNFLHRVPKIKSTNKYPDADFILDKISGYADDGWGLITSVSEEYSEHIPKRTDGDELGALISDYLSWISNALASSNTGSVSSSSVYEKLRELDL